MVVSWPDVTDGSQVVDDYAYQFNLMPTICELADVPTPGGWDGESFASALAGDDFDGRETLVCGHGIYVYSRAVYHDAWLYVRILHPGVFSYPRMYNAPDAPGTGFELLHDLEDDPHMTENLIEKRPDVADDLRARSFERAGDRR